MALAGVYVITLLAFLAIDAVMLYFVMYPLFLRHVGPLLAEDMRLAVAAVFYLFYVVGVLYFAVMPGLRAESLGLAAFNGALLGLVAYGTYEFTNMATLRGWAWQMLVTDTLWGGVLTAATAVIGYFAARWLL